jgi:flagellar motor switch protein FliM
MAQSNVQPRTTPLSIGAIRSRLDTEPDSLVMIPKSFGRFTQALCKEFMRFAATSPNFSYDGYVRSAAQIAKDFEDNSTLTEFLICADRQYVIFGVCDAVFGGVGNEEAYAEPRPFSKIEQSFMKIFFAAVGCALPSAFAGMDVTQFIVESLQDPNEDSLYPPFSPFVAVRILCNIHGYSGEVTIEMPQELAALFKSVDSEKDTARAPSVSEWAPQMSERVEGIEVELTAVLAEFLMNLDGITSLQKGQVIKLQNTVASPLALHSQGVNLFTAKLGQTASRFCLSIEEPVTSLL